MPILELTEVNFDSTLEENAIVLVDFWAPWCQPCLQFATVYEAVSQQFPDIIFGKIDVEAEDQLAADFQIRSIPTLLVIKDRVVVFSESGTLPEKVLVDLIKQAVDLDMSQLGDQE